MSTLLDMAEQGRVIKYDADLGARRQEERLFFLFPHVQTRIETSVATMTSLFETANSPLEELDAFLAIFCSGDVLSYPRQFHALEHIDQGVWELKTRDLRLFGWFFQRDCFVCTNVDDASRVKRLKMYAGYRDEAVRFRDSLPIDVPKFVAGDNPNAVISNLC